MAEVGPAQPFALDAYLRRVDLPHRPPADAAGLAAMQRAHRLAIPFENLDIPLGRGINLAPEAVFDKLVTRRRGGYCFEQNQLFRSALAAIGFDVRPLLARVWLMAEGTPPLTHTLNLVTIDGLPWIADAGFGGSFTPPMPLQDSVVTDTPDGAAHRLRREGETWMLERAGDVGATDGRFTETRDWQRQYSFALSDVAPIDLELSNHWTSGRPNTRFTLLKVVSRILPDGFASLVDRQLSLHQAGQDESREIASAAMYRQTLSHIFGLELSEEEVDRLQLFTA